MSIRSKSWTVGEVKTLREMWLAGEPVQVIADAIGRTRSAVISKAHQKDFGPHILKRTELVLPESGPIKCPCCGGPMSAPPPVSGLEYIPLPKIQRRIMEVLINAYPKPTTYERIVDFVYWDNPNGGPSNANNTLAVTVNRLKAKLEPLGWGIGSRGQHHGIMLYPLANKEPSVKEIALLESIAA